MSEGAKAESTPHVDSIMREALAVCERQRLGRRTEPRQRMPANQKRPLQESEKVFILVAFAKGTPLKEIARILGRPMGTVASRVWEGQLAGMLPNRQAVRETESNAAKRAMQHLLPLTETTIDALEVLRREHGSSDQ